MHLLNKDDLGILQVSKGAFIVATQMRNRLLIREQSRQYDRNHDSGFSWSVFIVATKTGTARCLCTATERSLT